LKDIWNELPGVDTGKSGIFFLKHVKGNVYDFVDGDHPIVPAGADCLSKPKQDTLLTVAEYIAGNLKATKSALDTVYAPDTSYEAVDGRPSIQPAHSENVYIDATEAMFSIESRVAVPLMRKILLDGKTNQKARLYAAAYLVHTGDWTVLKQIEAEMVAPGDSLLLATDKVAFGLDGVSSSDATADITKLMKSTSVPVRRCAAQCLRRIGDQSIIPGLLQGMQDSDLDTSWQSLVGLSEVTRVKESYPPWRPYNLNTEQQRDSAENQKEKSVAFWRHWAKAHGYL
jgi:hypothetical protein